MALELPAAPHHAQGNPALEIVAGVDLAVTALDVSGVHQGVIPLLVPSCSANG